MARSNFSHKLITVPANTTRRVAITGNFLIITESDGPFEIGFSAGERFPLDLGLSLRMPEDDYFTELYLSNPSATTDVTLEFIVGTGNVDIRDARLNVIRARPDPATLPVGTWARKQVTIGAGATVVFSATALYCRNAILMAPIGNANAITCGPTAAAVSVIALDPGASYQVNAGDDMRWNMALWYANNPGGVSCTLEILYI